MTHLQDVHDKVEEEQKAGGEEEPIQQQAFDYTVRVCGGHPHFHELVEVMAHRSCNKQPATDKQQQKTIHERQRGVNLEVQRL